MNFIRQQNSPEANAAELLRLTAHFTGDIEAREVPSIGRGFLTLTKGFFTTDPQTMHSISMSTFQYEPINMYRKTRLGKYFLEQWSMSAALIVNDHQEPSNNLQVHIFPRALSTVRGETHKHPTIGDDLSGADVETINNILTRIARRS